MKTTSFYTDRKLHIYFADDDLDDIDFFKLAVQEVSREIKVTVAKDGYQLLEFLQIVLPDIIFLDLNMPRMNGVDCLKEIRQQKKYDLIPVIIYSTTAEIEQVDHLFSLGANLYVQKPATFTKIKDQLTQTLSLNMADLIPQPPRERFLISVEKTLIHSAR